MLQNQRTLLIAAAGVAGVALFLYVMGERADEPASSRIAKERERIARIFAEGQERNNTGAAKDAAERLADLDQRLARAYLAEEKYDKAIVVLERLITNEESRVGAEGRSARSYRTLSRYYEELADAHERMQHEIEAMSAKNKRIEMLSKAEDAKRREALREGKTVGKGLE